VAGSRRCSCDGYPRADTDHLLQAVSQGDATARSRLLDRHRKRLKQMIAVRMDRRLAARVDPSDVVQDVLLEADRKLADYLRQRPVAFCPGCGSSPGTG